MRIIRSRTLVTVAALATTLTLLTAAPATADTATYTAVVAPPSAFAGSTTSFTATVTNQSATQPVGSANITPPAGFTLTSITSFSAAPPATATLAGGTIRIRNLSLAFGDSASVTFLGAVSCTAVPGSWSVVARKSKSFNASSSDPILDPGTSSVVAGVSGSCHLAFAAPPTDAQVNTTITGQPFSPTAPPVTVHVLDGGGGLIANSTAPVTLGVSPAPSGGASGTGPVNASGGVATFPSFRIHTSGLGYNVVATTTAAGIVGSTPAPLGIWDFGITCPETGQCVSPTLVSGITTGQLTIDPGATSASMSLDVEGLDCPDYIEVSSVLTFASTGGGLKTITITIPRSVGGEIQKREVCYSSPDGFVDRFGVTRGPDEPGQLPLCTAPEQAPCVVSKRLVGTKKVIVFRAPAGDPRGRT